MQLFGTYLSPYTRRIGITLNFLGQDFEHQNVSAFATPDPVRDVNPVVRIPVLVLDDGDILVESSAIIDEIENMTGAAYALAPASGLARRRVMQIAAFAQAVLEKAQAAFYETRFHPEEKVHQPWIDHNDNLVEAGLRHLNGITQEAGDGWLAGTETISQADITAALAFSFVQAVRKEIDVTAIAPALSAFAAKCEDMPAFKACPIPT